MHAFTSPLLSWALSGIILASAVGALLICMLVLRYGFPKRTWDRESSGGRTPGATALLLGHAAASVCFAVTAILAVVGLVHQSRVTAALSAPEVEAGRAGGAEIAELRQALAGVEERLGRAEQLVANADARVAAADGRVQSAESRAGSADTRGTALQTRLDSAETRLGGLERRVHGAEVSARQAGSDATRALTGLKQIEQRTIAVPPPPSRRSALPEAASSMSSA